MAISRNMTLDHVSRKLAGVQDARIPRNSLA